MFSKIKALLTRKAAPAPTAEPTPAELRAWARENGITVGDRGRVPATVHAAFTVAHKR